MNSTRVTYNERTAEIDAYYNGLFYHDALGELDAEIAQSKGIPFEYVSMYKHDIFIKINKANALIMIYSLVESTVTNGIEEIYDKVKVSGVT